MGRTYSDGLPDEGGYAVVVVDDECKILFINQSASSLLGRDPAEVEGAPCWTVLALRTPDGGSFCRPGCPMWEQANDGGPRPERGLLYCTRAGDDVGVDLICSVLSAPSGSGAALLHMILPTGERVSREVPPAKAGPPHEEPAATELTNREGEVLQMLTDGYTTAAIADTLYISPITVRNHLQNAMRKFHVHRRLDAVVAWMRQEH